MANYSAAFWILFVLFLALVGYAVWTSLVVFVPKTGLPPDEDTHWEQCQREGVPLEDVRWRVPPGCQVCAGAGVPTQTEGVCDCQEGYVGKTCDRCAPGYTRDEEGKCKKR